MIIWLMDIYGMNLEDFDFSGGIESKELGPISSTIKILIGNVSKDRSWHRSKQYYMEML